MQDAVIDIEQIRAELTELPFRDGKREVFVGNISEMFEDESEQAIATHLRKMEQELREHTLILTRHENDGDALFVVQKLRELPVDLSWIANGMNKVSQITTVALEMILPGLAGLWFDYQFGLRFLGVIGFVLGVPLGLWHLIAMTKRNRNDAERK